MDMRENIVQQLEKIIVEMGGEENSVHLEIPQDARHGDFTTNAGLLLAKKLGRNPMEVAGEIVQKLGKVGGVEKVEIAKPGFINFFVSGDALISNLQTLLSGEKKVAKLSSPTLLRLQTSEGRRKIIFEFGDPNPFKEFHIGHLYTTIVGESLSRLAESQGADVQRACYQGDVGMHVAKAIWGMLHEFEKHKEDIRAWAAKPLDVRAKFLGRMYAEGAKAYEEDESAKKEMNQLNKKIYDRSDTEVNRLYDLGRKWSLDYFDIIYQRLGTHFNHFYFESNVGKAGLDIVKKNIGNVFEESQGAVIFPGSKYGLHDRVFINSLGLPTYEAKELGLAPTKFADFPYDVSVIITGNEINEYFNVLLKALSLIYPDLAEKTRHISHGMVRLPEGKMSSRTGNVVTGEWLLDTARQMIQKAFAEMDRETAEHVAVGAVKYAFLKNSIGQDTRFSFEESISLSGNSGPYLQYTFARTQSVLAKAKNTTDFIMQSSGAEAEEEMLLRKLFQLENIVESAAEHYAPNILCSYLFELAQLFNLFYQKHKIIASAEEQFRIALTAATGSVIKQGLGLLGIAAPAKM